MKKIKIFLASSITELESDRDKFQAFVDQLNEYYFDYGVRISLFRCETGDIAVSGEAGGKQTEFDKEIRDSELCIFLFFKKVGEYTRHEFEAALEAFKQCKKPKIVTYFKYVNTPEEASNDVKAFMQLLDKEIKHYYNVYQNVDTLKLGILMQLKLMKLDGAEPFVDNGKVMLGKQEIADTLNLPIFTGNSSLMQYRDELKELTKNYEELRKKRRENPDDEKLYSEFFKVSNKKSELEKSIKETEKAVLEMTRVMTENTDRGNLSLRQVAAYRALEQGDYSLALEILDFDEIMADLYHNENMADGFKDCVQINVNELLQRIEVLKADGINKDDAIEIKKIYETVYQRIDRFKLDASPLYDYAAFMYHQNEYTNAIRIAKQLEYYYSNPEHKADENVFAALYNLFGSLYEKVNKFKEAKEYYLAAVEIYKRLTEENPSAYDPYLVESYNNLGILYERTNCYKEAEQILISAVEIYEHLAAKNPAAYEHNLAEICNTLSILYDKTNRNKDAEETLILALKIFKRLAEENPSTYEYYLAGIYTSLGNNYNSTRRYTEAEKNYLAAIEIQKRLVSENPAAYEPDLAMSYNNLGTLYHNITRYTEAEKNYLAAVEIQKRLASGNPTAYEPDLAMSYHNLGALYKDTSHYKDAEESYLAAIKIQKRLVAGNPSVYELELARSYTNLGNLYYDTSRYKAAEKSYLASIKIYKRFATDSPAANEPSLAISYYNLGNLYSETNRYTEAEEIQSAAYNLAKKHLDNAYCKQIYDNLKDIVKD